MSCPSFKNQVAEALAKENLNNTDVFLVLDNGTTYKVTIAELIAAIGATGDITSIAPAGTTPLLVGSAPNYEVRGILGGNGISALVNAQNALRLNMQVSNAGGIDDGVPLIVNTASSTIAWRRLKAGNGITVEQDGNQVVITNSEVAQTSNTQIISQLSDLPSAVSGVIALSENTDYFFVNDVTSPSRFTMGTNTIVRSADPRSITLTYTGNETMFTCSEGNQVIKEISLSCPSGKVFSNNLTTTGSFVMRWVRIIDCVAIGNLSKQLVGLYNLLIERVTGSLGFIYSNGTTKRLVMQQVAILNPTNAAFTYLDLGNAEFNGLTIQVIELFNTLTGQTFLKGLPASANLPGEAFAFISQVEEIGNMTSLSGIAYGDPGFEFSQAANIPNTAPGALASLNAAATTDIVTVNVPVKANGVFTQQSAAYMTANSTGRITLTGKRNRTAQISAVISARPVSGTTTYTFTIAKNGVSIPASGISREIPTSAIGVVSLSWALPLVTGDFIEVFVTDTLGATDCEIQKLIFRVG